MHLVCFLEHHTLQTVFELIQKAREKTSAFVLLARPVITMDDDGGEQRRPVHALYLLLLFLHRGRETHELKRASHVKGLHKGLLFHDDDAVSKEVSPGDIVEFVEHGLQRVGALFLDGGCFHFLDHLCNSEFLN